MMHALTRKAVLEIQRMLSGLDQRAINNAQYENHAYGGPIFVIGPPRSGTTLFAQIMLSSIQIAYISNIMALWPSRIELFSRLTALARRGMGQSLGESHLGYVRGPFGVNEAGSLLRDLLDKRADGISVRRTLNAISVTQAGPLLVKNLWNAYRIERIVQLFPDAIFLWLTRDVQFNAQSLLQARQAVNGNPDEWWSVRPSGQCPIYPDDPCHQVVWQVLKINKDIQTQLEETGALVVKLSYESLCADPGEIIDFLAGKYHLQPRTEGPAICLQNRNIQKVSQKTWMSLEQANDMLRRLV